MLEITDYLPRWTKRVATESGGRDPLGLSRVAFNLTNHLLTGIITTTERARYYSFYTWILWHIEQNENPENYNDFVDAFRRREAVMGLATLASKSQLNPVGVEQLRNQMERGQQTGEYDCDFKVLPSNSLGGYGQYYSSSIYHLKLSYVDEFSIDRVDEGGKALAESFHQTIQNSKYIKDQIYLQDKISDKELKQLRKSFTLDSIKKDFADKERNQLIDIFFGDNENYLDDKSRLRRQTLTIALDLVSEFNKNDVLVETKSDYILDRYLLFSIYYEVLWIDDETISTYETLANHDHCYELWKQFCLHQFITQALETLLYAVLEAVGLKITGLSLEVTVEKLTQLDFFETLENVTGTKCSKPKDLLSTFGITTIPDKTFSKNQQVEFSPIHVQSEAQILGLEGKNPEVATAKSVLLLVALYGKWRGMFQDNTMRAVDQTAGQEIWAKPLLGKLDTWLNKDLSWSDALTYLIEEFVLNQHNRIMYEKRKIDGWIRRTNGMITKDQDYKPKWRASRFLNAAKIMADLNLVDINENKEMEIIPDGQKLLKHLLNQ